MTGDLLFLGNSFAFSRLLSVDKVHEGGRLFFGLGKIGLFCKLHGFQEIGHIAAQYVQGPDPFLILKDFFRRRAMDLVPIAARDNGHFLDGKVLVHLVKGRRGPRLRALMTLRPV